MYPAIATVFTAAATPKAVPTHPPAIPSLAAIGAGLAHRKSVEAAKLPVGVLSIIMHTGLPAAIAWAASQIPPPLAASAPPVKYLPTRRHAPHGVRPSAVGRPHVSRQPRR